MGLANHNFANEVRKGEVPSTVATIIGSYQTKQRGILRDLQNAARRVTPAEDIGIEGVSANCRDRYDMFPARIFSRGENPLKDDFLVQNEGGLIIADGHRFLAPKRELCCWV